MNYSQFEYFINKIIESKKYTEKIMSDLEEYFPYSSICFPVNFELPLEILQTVMNDSADWIPYWLYELNQGQIDGAVISDNKEIQLTTIKDLYNLLTNNPTYKEK